MRPSLLTSALLALSLAASSAAYAGAESCLLAGDRSSSNLRISKALEEVPELREIMLELMSASNISTPLKRLLEDSLVHNETRVRDLTKEIRKHFRLHSKVEAVYLTQPNFREMAETIHRKQSLNEKQTEKTGQDKIAKAAQKKSVAFVENKKPTRKRNSASSLAHELAHARFDLIFGNNIEALIKRLPDWIIRKAPDGVVEVNIDFYQLITERYAHQKQFEVTHAMNGRFFPGKEWGTAHLNLYSYKEYFAKSVPKRYKIRDRRLHYLKDYSLQEILLGKPFKTPPPEPTWWERWLDLF